MKLSIARFAKRSLTYCTNFIYSIVNYSESINVNAAISMYVQNVGIKNKK